MLIIWNLQANAYMELGLINCEQTTSDTSIIDWRDLKIKKINRTTRGIFGKTFYHIPLDKSVLFEVIAYIKRGGEYRKLPYRIAPRELCVAAQEEIYVYPELVLASDFPSPVPCPFPNVIDLINQHQ